MCGIAGYVTFNEPASADVLERMLKVIGHRGPDHHSGSIEGVAALGNVRLSIVDIAGGTQPRLTPDRKVIVVFNGEIFNYRELKADLEGQGEAFDTNSEIETLLKLYLRHGRDFATKIKGQFAIAIWDGRDETLTLFRDRFGIRPLFWSKGDDGTVSFASEMKALFAGGHVTPRINRKALLQTFRYWTVAGDTSAFEDVQQLPPGHMVVFSKDQVDVQRYWSWPVPGTVKELKLGSDEEYFEAFAEQMRAAVNRQRMADVPVGSYLSGGIDSSVLAMLLQELDGGKNLHTYSVSFADPEYDESSAQMLMAKAFGFDHSTRHIQDADIGANFPQVVWQAETPLFRTAPTPLFLLSKLVNEDGRKLVMTGEGADEILLGYDLFREVNIRRFWGRQPESKWRGKLFQRLYSYLPQYRNPRYLGMVLEFYRSTLKDIGDPHYAMAVRWGNGDALKDFFGPALLETADEYNPQEGLDPWLYPGYGDADDVERAQMIELQTLMGNYLLSSQGDRMSMAHGIEGRYPFLDEDFVEFAASLPRRIKLRGLREKFVLRQAFANKLPAEIATRPKVAYQAPDLKGFFIDGKCPDYVEKLMSPERIAETGLFNPKMVEALMKKGRSFKLDRVSMRDNMAFTLVLSTMLLDETFVRGNMHFSSDINTPDTMELI